MGLLRGILVALLLIAVLPASAADGLWQLNVQRSYFGLYPLQHDPHLQAVAERTCQIMAARNLSGHIYGRPAAGNWEGTGKKPFQDWKGYHFYTCYQNHRSARFAGAAYVVTNHGTFYVLLLR